MVLGFRLEFPWLTHTPLPYAFHYYTFWNLRLFYLHLLFCTHSHSRTYAVVIIIIINTRFSLDDKRWRIVVVRSTSFRFLVKCSSQCGYDIRRNNRCSSTMTPPSISTATERLKAAEVKREEKRVRQVMGNREREAREKQAKEREAKNQGAEKGKGEEGKEQAKEGKEAKEKGENPAVGEKRKQDGNGEVYGQEGDEAHLEHKRPRTSDLSTSSAMDTDPVPPISTSQITLLPPSSSSSTPSASTPGPSSSTPIPPPTSTSTPKNVLASEGGGAGAGAQQKISVSKALPEVRGHTSYLTFATLVPYAYAQRVKERSVAEEGVKQGDEKGKKGEGEGNMVVVQEAEVDAGVGTSGNGRDIVIRASCFRTVTIISEPFQDQVEIIDYYHRLSPLHSSPPSQQAGGWSSMRLIAGLPRGERFSSTRMSHATDILISDFYRACGVRAMPCCSEPSQAAPALRLSDSFIVVPIIDLHGFPLLHALVGLPYPLAVATASVITVATDMRPMGCWKILTRARRGGRVGLLGKDTYQRNWDSGATVERTAESPNQPEDSPARSFLLGFPDDHAVALPPILSPLTDSDREVQPSFRRTYRLKAAASLCWNRFGLARVRGPALTTKSSVKTHSTLRARTSMDDTVQAWKL
ncbi:hypothetical protein NMY22_g19507 [Coprinellus aureogranulatus]|nr:hypothetical protein NMY22_g19507 [Coprinellus aureogranulatus]